ncbi:MAG: hypothetical protein Q8O67_30585 [Deltaproteobacteria bacterium]|nr:hypothetical protein [Deltaproteobacteria bacterium]
MSDAPKQQRDVFVVVVLAALSALPLWLARFPIAQDLSAHIETAAQIRALWQGDVDVAAVYRLHAQPWPNATPVLLLAPLLGLFDGLVAGKLLLTLGVIAWPASIALLLARLQRPAWLALLVLPTSFDLSFSYGFLHFVMGKPLWALCLVAAVDVARTASWPRLARLALLLALLFATHLMLFASALPLCAVVFVVCASGLGTRLKAALATAIGGAPAVWWWSQQPPARGAPPTFPGPIESLARVWSNLGDLHSGPLDAVPWALALAALIIAIATGTRTAFKKETVAVVVVAVAVVAFAWLGPVRLPGVSVVAERFWSLGAALLVAVPPIALSKNGRIAVVVAALLGLSVHVVELTRRWQAFSQEEMGDFDALLARIPPGSRIATHYVSPFSSWGRHNALWHWGKLAALRGSSTDDNFAWRETCVVGLVPGVKPPRHPNLVDKELSGWDFLLVRGANPSIDRRLAGLHLELVTSTGQWRLFRVLP